MLNKNKIKQQFLTFIILIISTVTLIICNHFPTKAEQPKLQIHPLPLTLEKWQNNNQDDYFDQIKPTKYGYLIWSKFPVKVFIDKQNKPDKNWVNSVTQAVQDWEAYLPLEIVENSELANIIILRKTPPLEIDKKGKITRARSALTTYQIYQENNILLPKFTILLSPTQTGEYIISAARHEIGHTLGIWGHSLSPKDVLYFSQIRQPVSISVRDVNTLKKIYQQPTSLGW
ncbi:peptidase [Anabaena sp. FACHB-1237]|uniref:peptidase n=1 Tax=Anabaena sp. FACHB-1237 TaxID=2692769 RepID=UPI0016802929|nr:peptidase [Anabaena sp. FACHB-1237]MBD2136263.1 peptidase [Anabaena sp. FACHB-1237]